MGDRKGKREAGFSVLELLVVISLIMIFAGLAIPGFRSITQYLRIAGDARNLNGLIAQAKMRAAADFTHARAYADLNANTYHLEVWNKSGNGGAGCWQTDGDVANACTASTSPVQTLSTGVTFGIASATAGAPNPQTTIAQAAVCGTKAAVSGVGATQSSIANTSCIEFNSRGIPICSVSACGTIGTPTANDALYVTDGNSVYGVTIIASGMMQDWSTNATTTNWQSR